MSLTGCATTVLIYSAMWVQYSNNLVCSQIAIVQFRVHPSKAMHLFLAFVWTNQGVGDVHDLRHVLKGGPIKPTNFIKAGCTE